MTETEQQFREELQELLDRYKDQLTNPQILRIAQPIFTKTIGFKDNPERCNVSELKCVKPESLKGDFKCID